jgi:hypothetical protein
MSANLAIAQLEIFWLQQCREGNGWKWKGDKGKGEKGR